jgi:hypothetical protein
VTKRTAYFSYLLRLWQTSDGDAFTWHASLEEPGTRWRQGFASLDELVGFLQSQVSSCPAAPGEYLEGSRGEQEEDQR